MLNRFVDAYEPPNCQNIPAPNVGTAPGPSVTNSSTNPDTSNSSTSSGSNPTIPNTTSASTATSSEALPSNSSGCSSSNNCHHQSPYDLRKKSPATCSNNNNNANNTSNNGSSNSSENWSGCIAGPSSSSTSSSATCTSGQLTAATSHGHHHYSLVNNNNNNSSNNTSNANYDYLPARKRPRRTFLSSSNETSSTTMMSAAHYLQYEMPDEVLLTIFSYLLEQDLCRVSLVCKRFQIIANDCGLWKRLYQSVYEYDLPLFNPEHGVMNFVKLEDCEYANPWKESFRQLYHGFHVRPGYQDKKYQGRNISYFNTVQAALDYADERNAANSNLSGNTQTSGVSSNNGNLSSTIPPASPSLSLMNDDNSSIQDPPSTLIFLHAGIYRGEFLVIDSDITLIGAAPGNVAESVVLGT